MKLKSRAMPAILLPWPPFLGHHRPSFSTETSWKRPNIGIAKVSSLPMPEDYGQELEPHPLTQTARKLDYNTRRTQESSFRVACRAGAW